MIHRLSLNSPPILLSLLHHCRLLLLLMMKSSQNNFPGQELFETLVRVTKLSRTPLLTHFMNPLDQNITLKTFSSLSSMILSLPLCMCPLFCNHFFPCVLFPYLLNHHVYIPFILDSPSLSLSIFVRSSTIFTFLSFGVIYSRKTVPSVMNTSLV